MTIKHFEEGMIRYKTKSKLSSWRTYFYWQIYINKAWRHAILVTQTGISFLFEYEMPNGGYYLQEVDIDSSGHFSAFGKSINKKRLPQKWRFAEWLIDKDVVL